MNGALLSSKKMDYCTPQEFFDRLNAEFHFTLDAAATDKTAKCPVYYTPETDGLKSPWNLAGGGGCVLQPSIREGNREMGSQGLRRSPERDNRCIVDSGPDGHNVFSRLHIRARRNPICARAVALHR